MRSRMSRSGVWSILPILTGMVWLVWVCGQFFKDRTWLTGLMFYVPTPLFTAGLLLLLGISAKRRSANWKWYSALAVLPIVFLAVIENRWWQETRSQSTGATLRLIHWNLCRTTMGWDAQRRQIAALHPDVIVLSETSDDVIAGDFPGYQVLAIHGMLIVSRRKQKAKLPAASSAVPSSILCQRARCAKAQ